MSLSRLDESDVPARPSFRTESAYDVQNLCKDTSRSIRVGHPAFAHQFPGFFSRADYLRRAPKKFGITTSPGDESRLLHGNKGRGQTELPVPLAERVVNVISREEWP